MVVVASHNPVKVESVRRAVLEMLGSEWKTLAGSGSSGVSDQPMSSSETLIGARNRAAAARAEQPDADLWVGIEGGVEDDAVGLGAFAWVVAISSTTTGTGRSATFYLPEILARLVRNGVELGHADDQVFGRQDSKRKDGAIGILSGGVLDRTELYRQAVIAALLPFSNPQIYAAQPPQR